MWIDVKKRRGRSENLFVFQFTSIEEDFEPYIEHLTGIVECLENKGAEARLRDLIEKIRSRCDDLYAIGEIKVSSYLFADEMAELATHMSYLLLYVTPKKKESKGE